MRVKLCWRRDAAQLVAKIKDGDWEGTLEHFAERAKIEGVTHFLLVQREGQGITAAALVPTSDLVDIWCAQRDISRSLIAAGKLGRRNKNHAMNGSSPTLWLEDDAAPAVTAELWNHAGVQNVVSLPSIDLGLESSSDDTFDDIPGIDYSLLGSDGAEKTVVVRSHVKRDQRVRAVVLKRAEGRCEREVCGAAREYLGFLDVHHILGVETSDRVWNCVAICPNCHREAHVSPDRDELNTGLLRVAMRYKDQEHIAASGRE